MNKTKKPAVLLAVISFILLLIFILQHIGIIIETNEEEAADD